tara:strand:- start:43629 stop:44303 length:675 start_codon:yes stop_codon:yes gene_type:complete
MVTINEVISRIRGQVKAEVQDAFVTDRYIYSLVTKYAKFLMRRQDFANKLMKFNSIWNFLPFVELIEIDKVEAHCTGIKSGCTIKRTKEKMPDMIEGYWGPLIRTVSSIDNSIEVQPTQPGTYTSITKTTSFRYNKKKYYWYLNNYLYFPDMEWDAVRVEAVFDDDISAWLCEDSVDQCIPRYEQELKIPDFLLSEIESQILNVMFNTLKIPSEDSDNKLNPNR